MMVYKHCGPIFIIYMIKYIVEEAKWRLETLGPSMYIMFS